MRVLHSFEADVPSYAVPYLEYGDDSGMDTGDVTEIDAWFNSYAADAADVGCTVLLDWDTDGGSFFTRSPAFGMPADCVKCCILFVKE